VEIPGREGPPYYATLEGNDGEDTMLSGEQLRPTETGERRGTKPSALKLDYKVEDDLVRITATVFYGDFDVDNATPESLHGLPHEPAGSYSGRLDDEVRLSGMEQAGLEPLTLKIVTAQGPRSVRPEAVSKVPSVQFAIDGEDRMSYKLTLRNLSSKTVTACLIDIPEENDNSSQIEFGPSLIAPGAVVARTTGIPHRGKISGGRFVEAAPPPFLILEAVLFQDNSYEGDTTAAAQMASQRMGGDVQRQRINQLVQALLLDAHSDDALIKRLQSGVSQLTEDADDQLVDRVRSQFPGLPNEATSPVKSSLRTGLNSEKQLVQRALNEYRGSLSDSNHHDTLAVWWEHWRKL
jgi:hypothetical protein